MARSRSGARDTRARVGGVRVPLVLAVVSLLAISGCGSEPPRLQLTSVGDTIDGTQGKPPPYFTAELCGEDGEHTITITDVRVEESTATGARFAGVVNWPGGDDAVPPGGYAEPLPPAFVPAKGSAGTVNECGSGEQTDVAIVFPELSVEAVGVTRLRLTFETDGQAGNVNGAVSFVHCGTNQVVTEGSCADRPGG